MLQNKDNGPGGMELRVEHATYPPAVVLMLVHLQLHLCASAMAASAIIWG